MLNSLNANLPTPPYSQPPGLTGAPFQWLPAGVAFFRRQIRPVVGCGVLGVAVGVAYLALATPQYTAVATISIDSRRSHAVGGEQAAGDWQSESAYVESQVALIQSPATLRGVVAQLQLDRDPFFASTNQGPLSAILTGVKDMIPGFGPSGTLLDPEARANAMAVAALSRMLDVWRIGTTSVVEVRMQTPDRAMSARLANAVTKAYMAQQLVAITDTTHRAGEWLQSRVGELRAQAVDADRAVQVYKAKHNIVDVAVGAGVGLLNEQQLGELNTQVAAARARVAASQARYEQAQASTVDGVTGSMGSDAQPNTVMAGLRQEYLDASRREADLSARMGPTHGAVVLQHKAVLELAHSMQTELARQTQTYRADYGVAQADLRAIDARLAVQVAAAAQTNIERSELRSLQSSANAYRQIYENFLQRFTQAMQDQSYPISDARVAAIALPPMDRSAPRGAIALAISLMLGMTLGVTIAVCREAMDATVRTIAQLRLATGLDCLGVIPGLKSLICRASPDWRRASRASASQGRMLVPAAFRQAAVNPDSAIAEAVHGVRVASTRQSALGRDVRVIGCVSIGRGEGTSTFAANLAFALATGGERTVLVDMNRKEPWLTTMLAPAIRTGVRELAAREATVSDVAQTDAETGLRFVGQSPGGPGQAVTAGANVGGMLGDLRDRFDVVVLDLPPMDSGGATTLLSDMVDGLVLVTRWGSTPRPLLSEALSRTAAMDALFLGTVMTHCDPKQMRLYPRDPAQSRITRVSMPADAGI